MKKNYVKILKFVFLRCSVPWCMVIDTVNMLYAMLTFGKTKKYYFLQRMKFAEDSLMKSSGNISKEH